MKFDPNSKLISHIRPDLSGDDVNWCRGAMADDGIIYCVPNYSIWGDNFDIIKIDTNTDFVVELCQSSSRTRSAW